MIRLLSLFSGIGAFESALRRGGYQFETVNYCEIDPYAAKAYSQIHGIPEEKNLHDVREVNPLLLDNINLVTFGFPCQDISVAGKQKGFEHDGERTRSGLFFEALRIIEFLQPEYAICENVKALTSKKFEKEFNTVLSSLAEVGYNNYWKVLNAKDFGIPQNRERVFIISIRKDIDTGAFTFPEKQELKLRVKDMLEPVVDEKYYIDNERSRNLIQKIKITEPIICRSTGRDPDNPSNREKGCNTEQTLELKKDGMSNTLTTVQKDNMVLEPKIKIVGHMDGYEQTGRVYNPSGIACTLRSRDYKDPMRILEYKINESKIKRLGNLYDENAGGARAGNVYAPDGLAPTIRTAQGGGLQPHILVNPDVCGNDVCRTIKNQYYKTSTANFERTGTHGATGVLDITNYRIRKLTPRECFRLMGFSDVDFDKIKGISNTQLYKMAGNSIVVNVLEAIFKQLFKETNKE